MSRLKQSFSDVFGPLAMTSMSNTPKALEVERANRHLNRPIVFDPALIHYNAYRAGEPHFGSSEEAVKWHALRGDVIYHVLQTIANSTWADHLILRGSTVLASWYPDRARRPGDLDWVVTPADWRMQQDESKQLIDELISMLQGERVNAEVHIPIKGFALDEIWTYEKAPGMRIIVPWQCDDRRFDGTIQMDVVFSEVMPSPPVMTPICVGAREPINMQVADKAVSLAWKLLWVVSDIHPVGKDLYDAVILAEDVTLSLEVVQATFVAADEITFTGENPPPYFNREAMETLHVEWEDFQREYPVVQGTVSDWRQRLVTALQPLWDQMNEQKGQSPM